jgi:hypothetical protein
MSIDGYVGPRRGIVHQPQAAALVFNGRKRARDSDTLMAEIVADRLVEHLRMSGYVIMKRPRQPGHSTPPMRQP